MCLVCNLRAWLMIIARYQQTKHSNKQLNCLNKRLGLKVLKSKHFKNQTLKRPKLKPNPKSPNADSCPKSFIFQCPNITKSTTPKKKESNTRSTTISLSLMLRNCTTYIAGESKLLRTGMTWRCLPASSFTTWWIFASSSTKLVLKRPKTLLDRSSICTVL